MFYNNNNKNVVVFHSVPTVDGLAENLFRAMSSLQASIALNFCKEVISSSSPLVRCNY